MQSVDRYKEFFRQQLGIEVRKPSMLTIIALLTLNEILVKGEFKINAIPIKVFQLYPDVVKKYTKEISFEGYPFHPSNIYNALKEQPYWKKMSVKNFRLDERLYKILSNIGQAHTSLFFILKACARELLENTDPVIYEGVNRPIDFKELASYEDASLRPYQTTNKREIYRLWENNRSIMLQMPTGTGKTRLFVSIVNDVCRWAKEEQQDVNILLLAHRKELISQISHNVGITYSIPHGLIVANNDEQRQYHVQVGSVPTLNVRLDNWKEKEFDIIIVDEAHHVKATSYNKILKAFPNAKVLGVTATPCRLNGASFHPEFDELIVSPSVSKFIKDGYLCDYDYYSIKPESKLNKEIAAIKNFALDGDYLDSAMMEVMDRSSIRANIIDTYLKYARGKKGIVYTINRQHNDHICARFKEAGVKAAAIDGTTPAKQRDYLVERFRQGFIDVLCNVNIFSEGFDCPDVEFIQLARPTKSLSMYLQQVGRGLRTASGKEKVLFLDNVGLYNRFGFPSARRHWRHHFEGRYEHEEDDYVKNFSVDETEGKELNFIDEYEEGQENVDLLHTSIIEDPSQIDEYGYIKDFDGYISKQVSTAQTVSEKLSVLNSNLKELRNEEKIFKKYRIEIPNDVIERINKLQKDIDSMTKEEDVINCISEINWRMVLNNVHSPYNGKSIRGVMQTLYSLGYHVHVVRNKDGNVKVSIEERPYISEEQEFLNKPANNEEVNKELKSKLGKLSLTIRTTYNMSKRGMTDMEISRKRGLAISTIAGHLCQLIKIGLLDVESVCNIEIIDQIEKLIAINKDMRKSEIFDHFGGKISYNEINYVLAKLNSY